MTLRAQGFEKLGEHDVYSWRAFRLVTAEFAAPDGSEFSRTFLRHPGAVGIVAIDVGSAVLVNQYRPAVGRAVLEIPAGTLEPERESPLECAQRELAEEVGAVATTWRHLSTYTVAVGVSDELLHLYLATGLSFRAPAADGVEERFMTVTRLPLADVPDAIADGRLDDAKTMLGLLLARSLV